MILMTHVYSRKNAGDGLLVDLAIERLEAVGFARSEIVLAAMDPSSFNATDRTVQVGTPRRSLDWEAVRAAAQGSALVLGEMNRHATVGSTARAFAEADAFVAVGGGYLRAGSLVNRWGAVLNHLPQLELAARSDRPSVYLPQSVGPLRGWQGRRIRSALHRLSSVHLRDDRSFAEVGVGGSMERTPDLAVLALADRGLTGVGLLGDGPPALVARAIEATTDYADRLLRLARVADADWAVQAQGSSEKSDETFYANQLGVESAPSLAQLLSDRRPCVVVSVRLHGALQALLAGVPAIHLGYERKSWGAYADLGLSEWIHAARDFDVDVVAGQVAELSRDDSRFWQAVSEAVPALQVDSLRLTESLMKHLRP